MTGILRCSIRVKREAQHDVMKHHITDVINAFHKVANEMSDGNSNGLQVRVENPDLDGYGVADVHLTLEAFNFSRDNSEEVIALEDAMMIFQGRLYEEAREALNSAFNGQHLSLGVEYGHFIKQDGP